MLSCFLNRGTWRVVKAAEDAAILRLRLQERTAALARVKELAGVVGSFSASGGHTTGR